MPIPLICFTNRLTTILLRCSILFFAFVLIPTSIPGTASAEPFFYGERFILESVQNIKNNFSSGPNDSISILAAGKEQPPKESFCENYRFHWTRDAAITIMSLIDSSKSFNIPSQQELIDTCNKYIEFERIATSNMSPDDDNYSIAKFNQDGTPAKWFNQDDGPALRALCLMKIATLFKETNTTNDSIHQVITKDIDFTIRKCGQPSCDVWEEECMSRTIEDNGNKIIVEAPRKNLFTLTTQIKALQQYARIFSTDEKRRSIILEKTNTLSRQILSLWFNEKACFVFNEPTQGNCGLKHISPPGSDLNTASIIGFILYYSDMQFENQPQLYPAIDDERTIRTVFQTIEAFSSLYPINIDKNGLNKTLLIGRYVNDTYDGSQRRYGNPWPLTTHALSEFLYILARNIKHKKSYTVTELSLPFYRLILTNSNKQLYTLGTHTSEKEIERTVKHIQLMSDNIILNAKTFACLGDKTNCAEFNLPEQFDRLSGKPASARNLTWSYASLLSALSQRKILTR